MNVKIFENQNGNDELAYLKWLADHPKGYVLNIKRGEADKRYRLLHCAVCHSISIHRSQSRQSRQPAKPFTGENFIKICASSPDDLLDWLNSVGADGLENNDICSICNPELPDELSHKRKKFEAEVERLLADTPEKRREKLATAPKIPEKKTVKTEVYERNPYVVAEVLYRADGKCEICHQPAPFKKRNGKPYLEVHHKIPLAKGGEDTVENALATCPNCHREQHFGEKQDNLSDVKAGV